MCNTCTPTCNGPVPIVVYWMQTHAEARGRFVNGSISRGAYTEDIELAKRCVDEGGQVRLLKLWLHADGAVRSLLGTRVFLE